MEQQSRLPALDGYDDMAGNHPIQTATSFGPATSSAAQSIGLLTTKQAAIAINCTVRFLEAGRQSGNGPRFVRLSRNLVRYRMEDLREFVEQRLKNSTSAP